MKLMHLSDLHLGKRVNEFPMLEDQKYILKEILKIAEEENIRAVLIAGDVYDKPVPPAEAVQVFDDFLTALAEAGTAVFVISGNHDSPERISFGGRLMSSRQVYMSPVYEGRVEPVELTDEFGSIFVYMLPFLKPASVRRCWPEEKTETFDDALRCAVEHIPVSPECRSIILAHQFVMGAARCDSEELSIGGLDQVSADIFDKFDYAALGHIHGPQKVGRETVRYCGTPLKYSFSEAGHKKSVTIVEMARKGDVRVSVRELKPLHDMREIRGSYEYLTSRSTYQGTAVDDYLHITLTDEEDILDAMGKLRTIYPNVMRLDYDNRRTRAGGQAETEPEEQRSPLELLERLYQLQNNQPMKEEQKAFAEKLMREIWEEGQ
ncbi:MAG: exonuclease SbcCD subunit D [Enterocloster sp.]